MTDMNVSVNMPTAEHQFADSLFYNIYKNVSSFIDPQNSQRKYITNQIITYVGYCSMSGWEYPIYEKILRRT